MGLRPINTSKSNWDDLVYFVCLYLPENLSIPKYYDEYRLQNISGNPGKMRPLISVIPRND